MAHHFDAPGNPALDITDAYCFAGASDHAGPRTVFGMNTSPTLGLPWDPDAYYELKVDTDGDYVEDLTFRATFPIDLDGAQYARVELLTGAAARDRTARGTVITPADAPVGVVVECLHGIKLFSGKRRDPFFNHIPNNLATEAALATGTSPNYAAVGPAHDDFQNTSVRSYLLEIPVAITGRHPVHYWATVAVHDEAHGAWFQVQRAAQPNINTNWDFHAGSAHVDYNATVPTDDVVGRPANHDTDPASGIWGQMRDSTAAVVAARVSYANLPHRHPTARSYGAWVADTLLPNVLTFTPGTVALWDPWHGTRNGKGLTEEASDNMFCMIINEDFGSGLKPGPLLDHFPYVAPPPDGSGS
jgi:hypothetical protein